MRRHTRITITLVLALLALGYVGLGAQTSRQLEAQLKAAQQLEEITADLPAAIEAYRKLSTTSDRSVAAQAMLGMARCQENLGAAEAVKTYQRVIKEFPDQPQIVAVARARITASQGPGIQSPFKMAVPDTRLSLGSTVSPDGTLALELRNGSRIVERELATGKERVLLDASADRNPAVPDRFQGNFGPITGPLLWSPNGSMVAFGRRGLGSTEPQRIQIVVRATGETRVLVTVPAGTLVGEASWTANEFLCYSTSPTDSGPAPRVQYHLVSITTQQSRPILSKLPMRVASAQFAQLAGSANGVVFGDLTPDGKKAIVIVSERLSVVDLATEQETAITLGINPVAPKISPDGRLVAFLSKQTGVWGLYVAPLDRLPIRNPVQVANLNADIRLETWRKPIWVGKDVLRYDYNSGAPNIYRLDIDRATGKLTGAPEQLSHQFVGRSASVSPDGLHIAYTSREGGVIVMNADGSHARRLTESGTPAVGNGVRGWKSPEEVLVANSHKQDGNAASIQVANIATGEISTLRFGVFAQGEPNWQYIAARNELYYRHWTNRDSIVARSLVDGSERPVVTIARLGSWTVSRNGNRLFAVRFTSNQDVDFVVQELEAASSQPTPRVLFSAKVADLPSVEAWASDDVHALYDVAEDVRVVNTQSGQSWSLSRETAARANLFGPDTASGLWADGSWSPDGSWFAASIWYSRTSRLAFEGVTYDSVMKLLARSPKQ